MNKERFDYIQSIAAIAQQACKGTGLFPSVMIAQGVLESRNGLSTLSKAHHNHFGIKKGIGWTGEVALMPTWEVVNGKKVDIHAPFRKYPSLIEGFKDRVKFLQVNPRYTKYGVFSAKTPQAQCDALLMAGYATDPGYASLLKSIIAKYDLEKFDK